MTYENAIASADLMRPNAVTEEQKITWLNELEMRFQEAQDANAPAGTVPAATVRRTSGTMKIPAPFDRVYVHWLCAMLDQALCETDQYANDMQLFNSAWQDARAWWRRHNRPCRSHEWKVM